MSYHPLRGLSRCNCIMFCNTWARRTLVFPAIHFFHAWQHAEPQILKKLATSKNLEDQELWIFGIWRHHSVKCKYHSLLAKDLFPVVLMRMKQHVCVIAGGHIIHDVYQRFRNDQITLRTMQYFVERGKKGKKMVPILYKMTSAYHQHPFCLFLGFCLFVCLFVPPAELLDFPPEKQVGSFC